MKGEPSHNLSGLLRKGGLIGKLEVFHFRKVDQFSQFSGAIANTFCANEANEYITEIFVNYSDLLLKLKEKKLDSGWIENESKEPQKNI